MKTTSSPAYSDYKARWIIETERTAISWYRNGGTPNKETGCLVEQMQTYCSRRAGEYDNPEVIERHRPIIAELRKIADVAARITAADFNESTLVGSPLVLIDQTPISDCWTGETDDEGNHIQERVLANGETFWVIKHFFSDQELHGYLCRHTRDVTIKRFPECRRVLVHAVAKH